MVKRNKTNTDQQNTTQKTRNRATRTSLKTGVNPCHSRLVLGIPSLFHVTLKGLFPLYPHLKDIKYLQLIAFQINFLGARNYNDFFW